MKNLTSSVKNKLPSHIEDQLKSKMRVVLDGLNAIPSNDNGEDLGYLLNIIASYMLHELVNLDNSQEDIELSQIKVNTFFERK